MHVVCLWHENWIAPRFIYLANDMTQLFHSSLPSSMPLMHRLGSLLLLTFCHSCHAPQPVSRSDAAGHGCRYLHPWYNWLPPNLTATLQQLWRRPQPSLIWTTLPQTSNPLGHKRQHHFPSSMWIPPFFWVVDLFLSMFMVFIMVKCSVCIFKCVVPCRSHCK